jgi:hypothetical protein
MPARWRRSPPPGGRGGRRPAARLFFPICRIPSPVPWPRECNRACVLWGRPGSPASSGAVRLEGAWACPPPPRQQLRASPAPRREARASARSRDRSAISNLQRRGRRKRSLHTPSDTDLPVRARPPTRTRQRRLQPRSLPRPARGPRAAEGGATAGARSARACAARAAAASRARPRASAAGAMRAALLCAAPQALGGAWGALARLQQHLGAARRWVEIGTRRRGGGVQGGAPRAPPAPRRRTSPQPPPTTTP